MGDNKKKKPGTARSAKRLTDYKSREAEGKTSQTDTVFQKALGKSKGVPHKG